MSATPTCRQCGRSRPVEFSMTAKEGQVVTMLSCTACEHRSWLVDGEVSSMQTVLAAAAGDADFVLERRPRPARDRSARKR